MPSVHRLLADGSGPWRERAACRGQVDVMFSAAGQGTAAAYALCRRCEVIAECRAWVTGVPGQSGVVAGTSERDRRDGRRAA